MMPLSYLKEYEKNCDIPSLLTVKSEREARYESEFSHKYRDLVAALPEHSNSYCDLSKDLVTIGKPSDIPDGFKEICQQLIPWRKGPFNLFGIEIDAEWRSDFKWNRLKESLGSLKEKRILDIGCNNGYFMFRMMHENPQLVLGIDPALHCCAQFRFLNHFAQQKRLQFEMFGIDEVKHFDNFFDLIFSMGILYHHRNPMQQLIDIREALRPKGEVILETIGIAGDGSYAIYPEDRYAQMRNVWFVPTLDCFYNWVKRANFINIELISSVDTTFEEQRLTDWCPPPYQSLQNFLDPNDISKTVEGYPAPQRFCLKAQKR